VFRVERVPTRWKSSLPEGRTKFRSRAQVGPKDNGGAHPATARPSCTMSRRGICTKAKSMLYY